MCCSLLCDARPLCVSVVNYCLSVAINVLKCIVIVTLIIMPLEGAPWRQKVMIMLQNCLASMHECYRLGSPEKAVYDGLCTLKWTAFRGNGFGDSWIRDNGAWSFTSRDRSRSFIDWLGSVEHTYTDSILGEILGFCPRTRDQHVIIYCKIQREIQKSNAKSRNPTWNPEIQLEIHLKSGNPARNPEILTKSRNPTRNPEI